MLRRILSFRPDKVQGLVDMLLVVLCPSSLLLIFCLGVEVDYRRSSRCQGILVMKILRLIHALVRLYTAAFLVWTVLLAHVGMGP